MSYNITAKDPQPTVWSHINGSPEAVLDRYCVSELCRGWPVYGDASEWANFRDLFADRGAWVVSSWSGPLPIDDFIQVSKDGRSRSSGQDFILHRETGTLVDLNPTTNRAVGKMKATVSQRFTIPRQQQSSGQQQGQQQPPDFVFDVDSDVRFVFFCKKPSTSTPLRPDADRREWKVQYVRLFHEKDRLCPVDGRPESVPRFDRVDLLKYPVGYQYLGLAQSMLGHKVRSDLPTLCDNEAFAAMYEAMGRWLRADDGVADLLGVPAEGKGTEPRF
ncbi:hypothetical protein VTN02DRAFT_6812 [Thermoascus thermophilus]